MLTSIFQAQFPYENKLHRKEVSSKHGQPQPRI